MNVNNLWGFIQDVKVQLPKGIKQITSPFHSPFVRFEENESFSIYQSKSFSLNEEVNIEEIKAKVFNKNDTQAPFMLAFKISGQCINLSELKLHYPELTVTNVPRGRSLEEETSYSTIKDKNNLALSFGFAEKNPDCLRSIVFNIG